MSSRVSDFGDITIDQDVRDRLGIEPGMIAYQRVIHGRLVVDFLPAPHRRSLFGVFRLTARRASVLSSDDIENAVVEAIADHERHRDHDGP
jgi:hypothetical protein